MSKFEVEKQWVSVSGNLCVVLAGVGSGLGHRCGYVAVTADHPMYGHGYSDGVPGTTMKQLSGMPPGKRGIIPVICAAGREQEDSVPGDVWFDVHGSLTYSGSGDGGYPVEGKDRWWFGFDCAHFDDTADPKSLEFCVAECESLSAQLQAVKCQQ